MNSENGAFKELKDGPVLKNKKVLPFLKLKGIYGEGNAAGIAYNPNLKNLEFAITAAVCTSLTTICTKVKSFAVLDVVNGETTSPGQQTAHICWR